MKTKYPDNSDDKRSKPPMNRHRTAETKIIFYTGNRKDIPKKLRNLIEPGLSDSIEIYVTLGSLKDRLSVPLAKYKSVVVVISAENWEDLMNIVSIEHLLRDTRLLLILPNRRKETISLGHRLRPRFVTYKDSDFRELVSVIRKMVGDTASRPRRLT
jgi:hypothetical protein